MSFTTDIMPSLPSSKSGYRNRCRALLLLLISVIACASCASRLTPDVHYGYAGIRSDAEVAIVRGMTAGLNEIDGIKLKHSDPDKYYREARVLPGVHTVTLYRWFGVSVLIVPNGYVEARSSFSIDLEPGHVYELYGDRTTGPGFRTFLWIVDATTGKVVAGEKRR